MAGCVSCFILPLVLFLFHRFIQPLILKFWNPWEKKEKLEDSKEGEKLDTKSDNKLKYADVNMSDILKGNCCIRRECVCVGCKCVLIVTNCPTTNSIVSCLMSIMIVFCICIKIAYEIFEAPNIELLEPLGEDTERHNYDYTSEDKLDRETDNNKIKYADVNVSDIVKESCCVRR